jgi:hypothetical protein
MVAKFTYELTVNRAEVRDKQVRKPQIRITRHTNPLPIQEGQLLTVPGTGTVDGQDLVHLYPPRSDGPRKTSIAIDNYHS